MKKIYTTIALTLLSLAAFSQAGTFDWEDATGNNTDMITQTVDGVTTTFITDVGTNVRIINVGGLFGTTGNVVLNDPNVGAIIAVVFTFSDPISIESIYSFDNDTQNTDPVYTFTPTGGNNSIVEHAIPDYPTAQEGILVPLNWENVTAITITSNSGPTFFLFDDIIFSPAIVAICDTFQSQDVPGDIDPGSTQTADCENDPNFYSVALPFLGEVGTDIFVDEVMVDISHTYTGDISLVLQDNEGNEIELATNLGGGTDDAYNGTVFKDGGADITTATAPFGVGPYAAQGGNINDAFAGTFIGDDVVWNLLVCDNAGDDTGMVNDFTITFCDRAPLSVSDNELSQNIKLFPNPAATKVQFSEQVDSYKVFNVLGQIVLRGSEQSINVQDLKEGMYFVNITKGNTVGTQRLIVKH